jgi:oligoribonuclease
MILFLDLETTGLNPQRDRIVEVAAVLMADDLSGEKLTYEQSVALARDAGPVDPYVVRMHTASGLWARIFDDSRPPSTIEEVDANLATWVEAKGGRGAQLAGNSIHFDRAFMAVHMPKTLALLHYRQIDVSSFNEVARRFWPEAYASRPGAAAPPAHRALADIDNSVAQLRHYLKLAEGIR